MIIKYEDIAERAYDIWKKQGGIEGKEQEHWLQAEAELRKERQEELNRKKEPANDPAIFKPRKSR